MTPLEAWLMLGLVCLIGEIVSSTLFPLFVGAGCFAAALATGMHADPVLSLIVFALVSCAGILLLRPYALRRLTAARRQDTNVDALVGRQVCVVSAFDTSGIGRVKLGAEEWRARWDGNAAAGVGSLCQVRSVDGATLVVGPATPKGDA